jgi:hypothetical protein
MIEKIEDLVIWLLGEFNPTRFKKAIFKGTKCGAWVDWDDDEVRVGSIVEGVDGDPVPAHHLKFPFENAAFWSALEEVEEDAHYVWMQTHGCDDCDAGEGELGYPVVNPKCETCGGEGAAI